MSQGALTQLANGEDVVFHLNPQISYFKSVFRKYTKFMISDYEQTSGNNNSTAFGDGNNISFQFPSQGELLSKVSIRVKTNETLSNVILPDNIGTALIDTVDLVCEGTSQINNNIVERIPAEYINFMGMLNNKKSINSSYDIDSNKLSCNNGNNFQNISLTGGVRHNRKNDGTHTANESYNMNAIVPIPFSFTENIGSALPILKFSNKTNLSISITKTSDSSILSAFQNDFGNIIFSVIFKFIYLSEEEKYRFTSSDQEYLLKKVKYLQNDITTNISYDISGQIPNMPIVSMFIINNSNSATGNITLFNGVKFQVFIRGVNMQNDRLPHEFYSKLNINNHFKGCIFKDQIGKGKVNTSTQNGSYSTIENNIVYIPFALKDTEGPSGCIDTSSNDISLEITHPQIVGDETYSFKLYLIYHTIMTVKNDNIFFPYGFI